MSAAETARQGRRTRRALLTVLARVGRASPRAAEGLAGAAAVIGALARPRRMRQALGWARAHRTGAIAQGGLALALLANRGRFLAHWTSFAHRPLAHDQMVLQGREHLDAWQGRGAILLSFHLGPGSVTRVLRAFGYESHGAGEPTDLITVRNPGGSQPRLPSIRWTREDVASRGLGLVRARAYLMAGAFLRIAGDGTTGRAVFEVPLPGRGFTVRAGWWVLRRQTHARTLPVLVRREGGRTVLEVHPPLPDPVPDPEQDAIRCREALSAVLGDYVRRFPEQCVSVGLASAYGHVIQ